MHWGSNNETPVEIYTVAHLRELYNYDLEFEPSVRIYEALEYMKPICRMPVELYREALRLNEPRLLERAKQILRNHYKHLDFYFR